MLKSRLVETESKTEATAEAIDLVAESTASGGSLLGGNTVIGSYGEMHYNNLENQADGSDKSAMDFHRFVLFFGHQFTDSVRFFSELEVEHSIAGDGKVGEVELEQAFIEWDYSPEQKLTAGLFLLPVGILNETHEPETFYGVERNNVEKNIVPATWWEGGASLSGEITQGWSYNVAVTTGLFLKGGKYKVRDGRQKVGKANAEDLAYTGRIKYTGSAGLELGLTFQYQSDLLQSMTVSGADDVDATLIEAHAAYQSGPFMFRALYATWDIDDDINLIKAGADEQTGWYLEPSYRFSPEWGVFARYERWDNTAGAGTNSEMTQFDIGFNYWLTERVAIKMDYQDQDAPNGSKEEDGFNLGIGWSF
jgi:predicted porin